MEESQFQKDLQSLINKHSKEIDSHTPDFILAKYLNSCLDAFGIATLTRDKWYDKIKNDNEEKS